jgi:hypothetical protein
LVGQQFTLDIGYQIRLLSWCRLKLLAVKPKLRLGLYHPVPRGPGFLFVGVRPSLVISGTGAGESGLGTASREVLTTTTRTHVDRELVKADLLAVLNDARVKGKTRDLVQSAYDRLCGRS